MSLDYQLGAIANWKEVCFTGPEGKRTLKGVTETLIWATIPLLMGAITEKNHVEFYRRMHMYERVVGAFRVHPEHGNLYVTLADVKRHIGLRTNVHDESFAAFKKNLMLRLVRDTDGAVCEQIKELNNGK